MTINVNLKIFLFAILFYLTKQIQIYALLMAFAFLHEMGHLVCGLFLGFKPKALRIMPLGLCIEFSVIHDDYNKKVKQGNRLAIKKMILAIAGPITNILIIGVCQLLKAYIPQELVGQIIYTNILIAIFNLLPIYPLDGGRCIKSLIHIIKGNEKANEYINTLSNACVIAITMAASIAIYYYKNIAILFIVIYLWMLVYMENRKYSIKKRIYGIIEKIS